MHELQSIEVKGQRVLTTQQLAGAYDTTASKIIYNFNYNKERYILGKHYIEVTGEELRSMKRTYENQMSFKYAKALYLWTEKGALLHAKSLNTDKAWEVYDYLVDFYFRAKEELAKQEAQPERPWFIRRFRGKDVVLERDFIAITGVDIRKHPLFYCEEYFRAGWDFNGWGWRCDNEEFKREYGFDYGDDDCMMYLRLWGVRKALKILADDRKIKMNTGAYEMLMDGIRATEKPKKKEIEGKREPVMIATREPERNVPVYISITVNGAEMQQRY